MPQKYVIITAAGSGVRMNSPLPKQFIELQGKPVLMHTISLFFKFAPDINIILVLPTAQIDFWNSLCEKHKFINSMQIAPGGPSRFHSVKSGLKFVPDQAVVAIHDGVRPLASLDTISNAFQIAERFGNAIPALKINESVREVIQGQNHVIDRDKLRIIQTPQCFNAGAIKNAYNQNFRETFTDDASVLESTGERIYLTEGNRENIKITSPEDLIIADAFLKHQNKSTR